MVSVIVMELITGSQTISLNMMGHARTLPQRSYIKKVLM